MSHTDWEKIFSNHFFLIKDLYPEIDAFEIFLQLNNEKINSSIRNKQKI